MTTPSDSAESPLAEASPNAIERIFNDHPSNLSDEDLALAVAELRVQRERWKKAEAAGKRVSTKAPLSAPNPDLDLDDLGL